MVTTACTMLLYSPARSPYVVMSVGKMLSFAPVSATKSPIRVRIFRLSAARISGRNLHFFCIFRPLMSAFFCFVSFLIRVYRTILPPSFVGWWIALAPLGRNAPPALLTKLFLPPLLSYRQAIYCLVLLGDSEAMHGCRPCSTSLPSCAAFLSPPSFHFYQTIPCRPSAEREASHAEFRPLVCLLSGHFMPVFAPFYKNLANLLYKICFLVFFS